MSRNNTTQRGLTNMRDSTPSLTLNTIQFTQPNPPVPDPQTLTFSRGLGSTSSRKNGSKPSFTFNNTSGNMTLENFLPYAKNNSNKPQGKFQCKIILNCM